MKKIRTFLAAFLCVLATTPLAARERVHAAGAQNQKKGAGFGADSIKPIEKKDEKPRPGWNGFYGGLNAGAASSDTGSR